MTTKIPRLRWTRIVPDLDLKHAIGRPCGRSSHGVSWVPSTSRLVIHGGERTPRTPLEGSDATWVCDFSTTAGGEPERGRWRVVDRTVCPPARLAHAQASHAASSSVYVFGGRSGIGMEEEARNDLWKMDCSGPPGTETWSEVIPEGGDDGFLPEARSFHRMVCVEDSLYVFGGCGESSGRLSDLHRFDIPGRTWHAMGSSHHLAGRGGAALLPLNAGGALGVVAGFAGKETNDGHVFDVASGGRWAERSLAASLRDLRPRSVCVGGSFPGAGVSVIFGGEVEPSALDHEGAGGFENDLVLLDEITGAHLRTIPQRRRPRRNDDDHDDDHDPGAAPEPRGWSDGAVALDERGGGGSLFVFGGLAGNDDAPRRLDDLWKLEVSSGTA